MINEPTTHIKHTKKSLGGDKTKLRLSETKS